MRNLKKFLALVLAMMMVFSLMVTVNAATYPDMDKAEDAFVEGIEVLSGVGVIKGDEKGNFNPTANITRAEAAAIMYRIVTGDVKDEHNGLHTGAVQFTDVKDGDWFAGYVGYCADQGIIKGRPDGSFGPQANVTGYEMLAMLLRAIGYGQKGEFTGYGWEVSVGSRATTLGILDNVKTTAYGGNLRIAARRDVVADLAFQAITVPPTVTVSSLGDYNQYTSLVSNQFNPTLGTKVFGLKKMTGIIVGNQMTGETTTKLGVNVIWNSTSGGYYSVGSSGSYAYTSHNDTTDTDLALNAIIKFKTETGLDMFGHKVDVWYDWDTDEGTQEIGTNLKADTIPAKFNGVYAVRDLSTKTEIVKAAPATANQPDVSDTTTAGELGKVAKDLGFAVSNTSKAQFSDAFAAFNSDPADSSNTDGKEGTAKATPDAAFTNATKDIYLLISNSANKALNVVISLDVSLDRIGAVNNYVSPKTVTTYGPNHTNDDGGSDDIVINRAASAADDELLIYGEDDIAVGARVILNVIAGTSADANYDGSTLGGFNYYGINKPTEKKEGTVTSVSGTGKVTLADGTTLEPSVVWDTTNDLCGSGNLKIGASLTFILDAFGKYVRVAAGADTYLVGAYGYWQQEGIDGFKYYIQGVTDEGKIVTLEVTEETYKDFIVGEANNNKNKDIHHMGVVTGSTGGSNVGVVNPSDPQDTAATSINGYQMYVVDSNKVLTIGDWTDGPIVDSGDSPAVNNTIWSKDTKTIMDWGDDGNRGGAGDNADTPNYFTNDTKFHVITGWGSTLKVETKVGLTALLDGASSVEVAGWYLTDVDDTEHVNSGNNVVTDVYLVSVKRIQPSTFFYVKDAVADISAGSPITTKDSKAVQLQVYANGEDTTAGVLVAKVDGSDTMSSGTVQNVALTANTFYSYTVNGNGYYELTAVDMTQAGGDYGYNTSALTNTGTSFGDLYDGTVTIHAENAKVVDITGVDHGIKDYMSLRRAVEENSGIQVSVLLSGPLSNNAGTAVLIYVHTFA